MRHGTNKLAMSRRTVIIPETPQVVGSVATLNQLACVQPVELPHPPGDASKRPQLAPLKLGSLPEHDQESSADGSAFFETQNPAFFEDGGDHDGVADGHDTESHGLRTPYSLMLS